MTSARALLLVSTALTLLTPLSLVGCNGRGACAIERVYGVRVTIIGGGNEDGSGGAGGMGGESSTAQAGEGGAGSPDQECAATAIATDGDYTEELKCTADGPDCVCLGLSEIPGTFDIRVRLGKRDETKSVRVRPEGCSVETRLLTFFDE